MVSSGGDDGVHRSASADSSPAMGTTPVTPVAVIGMACRLPGGIDSPEQLWEALLRGDDLVTEIPADRWDADEYYDPEPGVPGRSVSKWGAFLDDVAGFDSEFFGINEREATAIDPQHRLLLETSWEAMEHAGLTPAMAGRLADRRVRGIDALRLPIGGRRLPRHGGAVRLHRQQLQHGVRADRLRPGAARSRAHGGHRMFVWPARGAHGLSQPARRRKRPCPRRRRLGDAGSAEVRRGVGAGHAVSDRTLPRLRRRGRRVRVRRGLRDGVAQAVAGCAARRRPDSGRDPRHGRQPGRPHREHRHTVGRPRRPRCIGRRWPRRASTPGSVGMVEAHGPGTPVGDPIEYASLAEVYGIDGPCALASVKTNFGHTQSASGALGLMKAVLALQHGVVPQNLHFTRLPDEMARIDTKLFVPQEITPWPTNGHHPRRAAVSSYGLSGTNVHAILEQAPEQAPEAAAPEDISAEAATTAPLLFPLSSTSADELRRTAGRLADWVQAHDDVALPDLAYTLARRRAHRPVRTAVIASSQPELTEALREVADGDTPYQAAVGQDDRGPVWVFSGQGSQWAAMGAELLATEPVFAATVAQAEPADRPRVRVLGDRSDVGAGDGDRSRPDPADAVHHAGRAGRHHEGIRRAPGRGHRALARRGRGGCRRGCAVAGRRGARDLPPLAADVPHRRFRRHGIGGTACPASAFGADGPRHQRRRGGGGGLAAVHGDRRCRPDGSRAGRGLGAA